MWYCTHEVVPPVRSTHMTMICRHQQSPSPLALMMHQPLIQCTNTASSATDIEGNLDGDDFDLFLLQSTYEAVEVLLHHHSFVTPPSFPFCFSLTEVEAMQDQTKFLCLLGITPVNQKISSTSIGTIRMSFLNNLVKALHPDKGSWDLEKYNTNSLVNAWRLK